MGFSGAVKDNTVTLEAATSACNNAPRLWLTGELATAARLHPESVRRAVRQGRIPVLRFGRGLRIPDAVAREILAKGLPA
jgi:hypothetical protein